MPEKFDAIVVGAGLSGLAAAAIMSARGMNVAIIERGDYPGAKNVLGGVLYGRHIAEVFPEFRQQAPLERAVVEQRVCVLSETDIVQAGRRAPADEHGAFTVQRAKFDRWLGAQAAQAGALIVPGTAVLSLLKDTREHVIGVRTNRVDGDLLADIVILADGAMSLQSERLGLHPRWTPQQLALMVKAVYAPPGNRDERMQAIEQRCNLRPGEGMTNEAFGAVAPGVPGTALLATHADSFSFSVSALLSDYLECRQSPYAVLQQAAQHPVLREYLAGCTLREYSAHLLPAGGYDAQLALSAAGVMVVGDAAQLSHGLHREGGSLAMLSGKLAGEMALVAHQRRDFTAWMLHGYDESLHGSALLQELYGSRKAARHYEKNRRLLGQPTEQANRLAAEFLVLDGVHTPEASPTMLRRAGSKLKGLVDALGLLKE